MKVIIVGGVAGGASCAARLRRLDETAEILMVERGPTSRKHTPARHELPPLDKVLAWA